jgi:hypothetical protein
VGRPDAWVCPLFFLLNITHPNEKPCFTKGRVFHLPKVRPVCVNGNKVDTNLPYGVHTTINLDVVDDLLKHYKTPEEILGVSWVLKQLTNAVLQRALQTELLSPLSLSKNFDRPTIVLFLNFC